VLTFPKINLVDSFTNPALSEGWFQYKVKAKPNLPMTTQVKNTAYIYFDANPAIRTNTAISTVNYTGINAIAETATLHLYPNPNNGTFTLTSDRTINGEYMVYDMMGSLIQQKAITTDRQVIALGDVSAGVYTLMVRDAGGSQALRFIISH
jgi:hypothetical protein